MVATWDDRSQTVAMRRTFLEEQSRKMKLAKSIKWEFIRMKKI
jgi:hypothetical protein